MITKFITNFQKLKDHHQIIFGFMILLATVIFSKVIEKIYDDVLILAPKQKIKIYIISLALSLMILYFANYLVRFIVS